MKIQFDSYDYEWTNKWARWAMVLLDLLYKEAHQDMNVYIFYS